MSLVSYAASVAGVWRLARRLMRPRWAFVAVLFYALNPNLLYLATTAMTEALFLALLVWTVVAVMEGVAALEAGLPAVASLRMVLAGVLVMGQVFTRYDGWIVGAAAWAWMAWAWWRSAPAVRRATRAGFIAMTMLCVAGPLLWFWYNAHFEGDWLDFMRGPYSAAAIERKTAPPGQHYRGWHNPAWALLFYMRTAQVDAAAWETGFLVMVAALWGVWVQVSRPASLRVSESAGRVAKGEFARESVSQLASRSVRSLGEGMSRSAVQQGARGHLAALLLWVPLPFYVYSVTWGIGADLYPAVVAALVLQRAVWDGDAARAGGVWRAGGGARRDVDAWADGRLGKGRRAVCAAGAGRCCAR